MRKLLLGLCLSLFASGAWAQCTGVFPPNTLCGNLSASPAPPSAFSSAGTVLGPGTTTVGHFATWNDTTGTLLADYNLLGGNSTFTGNNTISGTTGFTGAINISATTNFTGTFRVGGQTFLWPAAGTTVGGLGTNQTWTGNNTYGGGTVNFTGTTQLNGAPLETVLGGAGRMDNCTISATTGSNTLILSLKNNTGADPTSSSPCVVAFRSATAANGTYTVISQTAALSVTVPNGGTLGTSNSAPFRVWGTLWNNAGTLVMGAFQSVSGISTLAPTIVSLAEDVPETTTVMNTSSDLGGVHYTSSALSTKPYRILGYAEFATGQATAGQWVTQPATVVTFGPGVKLPGDTIRVTRANSTTAATTNSASFVTLTNGLSQAYSLKAAPNAVRYTVRGTATNSAGGTQGVQLFRDSAALGNPISLGNSGGIIPQSPVNSSLIDFPGVTTSVTYTVRGKTDTGTLSFPPANTGISFEIEELMD